MTNFQNLTSTFTKTIFSWNYYCDFEKICKNTFKIKVSLNILNSLLWENNIEDKFLSIIKEYPETRDVLPILLAVRDNFKIILNKETKEINEIWNLFNSKKSLNKEQEKELLNFFVESWLRDIFKNKCITNLNDYVFWIETWLDSNARKNRSWTLMENLVEDFIMDFTSKKWYEYKSQATAKWIRDNWWIDIKSDKSDRRFDFAIYNWKEAFLIETNFYWGWWSKLKAVAWEFSNLYSFLEAQWIHMFWITDWDWWKTALNPLEEAYNSTNWKIYNIEMLKTWILEKIIK